MDWRKREEIAVARSCGPTRPARLLARRGPAAWRLISYTVLAFFFLLTGPISPVEAQESQPDLSKFTIEDLMRVEVETVFSASKFQQKVTEAPASVTVITADEIRKAGYRTLAEVLRSLPGFFVDYDRDYSYAGLRGFSTPGDYSSGILLLIDGHRTNDNVYDSPNFGTEFILDVDLIKRVEVIRGPASVLYGANAFFGVINVITKRGRDARGPEISTDAGSLGSYRARATYGLDALKGPEILLSGTIYDSHGNQNLFFPEFDSPATHRGVAVDADRDKFYNFFARMEVHNFSIQGGTDRREKGVPTGFYGTVFNDPRNRTVDWSSYLDLKYQRTLASGWQIMGHVAYDRVGYDGTYVTDYSQTGIPPFTLNLDHSRGIWWTVGLDASRQLWKRHRITLGTETRINVKQDLSNNDFFPPVTYFNIQKSSTIPAIYIQDEYTITNHLILSGGVRYDYYALFGGSTNPRFALIYSPQEKSSIKLIYGQAFRAPSAFELFLAGNAKLHLPKINFTAPLYRKKLFASFEGQYMSQRQTVLGVSVGGYFVSNASLFAANLAKGFDVSISVYNLFNRFYQDPGSDGLIENGITQDGRTLRLKLTYRLASKN